MHAKRSAGTPIAFYFKAVVGMIASGHSGLYFPVLVPLQWLYGVRVTAARPPV